MRRFPFDGFGLWTFLSDSNCVIPNPLVKIYNSKGAFTFGVKGSKVESPNTMLPI